MVGRERELRSLFNTIAISMLFLVLFSNVYSLSCYELNRILYHFPRAIWLECLVDITCSLIYFLVFLLPCLIFHHISRGKPTVAIEFYGELPTPKPILKTIALFFVSVGAILAISYLNSFLLPSSSYAGGEMRISKPYQVVLAMFSSAIIPAFSEELLFRGVILSNLKPYGKGMAVIVSALLFGLMHMNATQLLYATAAGIVLGLVYVKTRSLWFCVAIHFANNMFNVLENYIYEIFRAETAWRICMLAELVIFFIGILSALIYILATKKETFPESIGVFGKTTQVSFDKPMDGNRVWKLFFCPLMMVYIAVVALNVIYLLIY